MSEEFSGDNIKSAPWWRDHHHVGFLFLFICIPIISVFGYYVRAQSGMIISGVGASAVTETGAEIRWTTDIPGNSHAYYDLSSDGSFSNTNYGRCDEGGLVTSHCAILTGLSAGTRYYYKVESYDASGTPTVLGGFSFTTISPNTLSGVSASSITSSGAQIRWSSTVNSSSVVAYGTASGSLSNTSTGRCDGLGMVTSHCSILTGLLPSTTYYYEVRSSDSEGITASLPGFSFMTTASSTPPEAPTGMTASFNTGGLIQLSWTDNSSRESRFEVMYKMGTSTSYSSLGNTGANSTTYIETSRPSGTYLYIVRACNFSGCSIYAEPATITVSGGDVTPPTVPLGVVASAHSSSQINLSWNSSSDAVGVTGYKIFRNGSYYSQTTGTEYSDTGLSSGVTYTYYIKAVDSAGNESAQSSTVNQTTIMASSSGPIGYWRFEGNGTSYVSGAPSATPVNGAVFRTSGGKSGGYAYLPASADYFRIPYNSMFDLPTSFTVEFWFRQRSNQSFYQPLVYKGSPSNNYNWNIFRQLWNTYNFGPIITGFTSASTGYWNQTSNPNQLSHNTWHHIAYTKDASGTAYYLDGSLIHSLSTTESARTPATDIHIGNGAVDTDIDELKIFNRAISSSEVLAEVGTSLSDAIAPTAPSWVSISPVSGTQINLAWGGMTDNVAVTGYKIYRDGALLLTTNSAVFSNTGLTPGTSYRYQISAYDAAGNVSPSSSIVSTTTPAVSGSDTTSPVMPTTLNVGAYSASQVNLSWTSATDNVGVVGYKIYRNDILLTTTGGGIFSYSDTGLSPETSYSYRVSAIDAAGNISTSVGATVTTFALTTQTQVSGPYISNPELVLLSGNSLRAKWLTDVPSDSKVFFGTISGSYSQTSTDVSCQTGVSSSVTSHCVVLSGLLRGAKYYYRISSTNLSGVSRSSDEFTFLMPTLVPNTTTATTTPTLLTTATMTATDTVALREKKAVFSVSLGGKYCIGEKTVAPVSFKVNPEDGGYFIVPGTGAGTGAMFANKTVDIPSGTYSWNATTNSGYVADSSTQGTFTISRMPGCQSAPLSSPKSLNTETPQSIQTTQTAEPVEPKEIPVIVNFAPPSPPPQQTFSSYADASRALEKRIQVEIPVTMPIAEQLQKVQDIRETFAPVAQSETVSLGGVTLSRKENPIAVVSAVNETVAGRATTMAFTDVDADGISDYDETRIYGTDPKNPDTDSDGIQDGAEILAGTDPLKKQLAPVLYEDPKQVTIAAEAPKEIFTVDKITPKIAPREEGRPEKIQSVTFSGKGLRNSYVTLYFFSTPIVVTVKTDASGNWEYTIDKEFEDGEHSAYVAMTDSGGKILMKSTPIPFVKTANAIAFGTLETTTAKAGFFQGNMLWVAIGTIITIVALAFAFLSFFFRKETVQ